MMFISKSHTVLFAADAARGSDNKVDLKSIRSAARLSRLGVHDDDLSRLASDMQSIVSWVGQLNAVDTDNVEPISHPFAPNSLTRSDTADGQCNRDDVLANAPQSIEGFFAVPKVVE